MEDKLALFFFNFFIPATLGFGSLCGVLNATGKERPYTILILFPLFVICAYYLYKNTLKLFKSK